MRAVLISTAGSEQKRKGSSVIFALSLHLLAYIYDFDDMHLVPLISETQRVEFAQAK